jgi:adenylate cyclase
MDDPDTTEARLSIEEFARTAGTSVHAVRVWQELGLVSSSGDTLAWDDIERVRVLQFVQERGIAPETVARMAETQGDLLGDFLETSFEPARPGPLVGLADAADATGLDPTMVRRIWVAAGFGDQHRADQKDLDALRGLRMALDAGLPEAALVQLVRVFADALGRVADAEARLFHHYVHERFRAQGLAGPALVSATRAVSLPLMELIEPTVLYFHSKAFERARREDLLLHLAEDTAPPAEIPGEIDATILFVDLSAFTVLTEAMGDDAAAQLMERFSDLVRQAARDNNGHLVKQIGDEFMLAFTEAGAAVRCGLQIDEAASTQPQFPAVRMGAHSGRVLYREGDYVGATVNVAARVVAVAGRHQLVVTDTVRPAATAVRGAEVRALGTHEVKGIAGRLELFEVRGAGDRRRRDTDPVCLMELHRDATAARLTWRGTDLGFCSDDCLRLFVADPQRYVDA